MKLLLLVTIILLSFSLIQSFQTVEDIEDLTGDINADDCTNTEEILKTPSRVLFCARKLFYNKPEILPDSEVTVEYIGNVAMTTFKKVSSVIWPYYSKDYPQDEEDDVTPFVWYHKVNMFIPTGVELSKSAMVYIDGGSNLPKDLNEGEGDAQEDMHFDEGFDLDEIGIAYMANKIKAVVIQIYYIPNQPILINGKYEKEDGLISYTWQKFIKNSKKYAYFPLHLPMSIAVTEIMTWSQEILMEQEDIQIDTFVVAGGSKRGWTTWLAGIVDDRIKAIVPIVIDILNVRVQFDDINDTYAGKWPIALGDYNRYGLTNYRNFLGVHNVNSDILDRINDPNEYRFSETGRMSIPKYIINASGDDFFIPIGTHKYYRNLPNPSQNFLRYVENSGHGVNPLAVVPGIGEFFRIATQEDPKFPLFVEQTTLQSDDSLTIYVSYTCAEGVDCEDESVTATLWSAVNPHARDFRFFCMKQYENVYGFDVTQNCGIYEPTELELTKTGRTFTTQVTVDIPQDGWKASLIKMKDSSAFAVSTQVYIQNGVNTTQNNVMPQQDDMKFCGLLETNYDVFE